MSVGNPTSSAIPRRAGSPPPEPRTGRCVVCGGTSEHVVLREGIYEARRCACGTVYTHPLPETGTIDFTDDAHPQESYALSAPFKAAWMARHCPPGRLLEVGCGHGEFLAAARGHGYEVCGLEPHPARAAACEAQGIPVRREFLEATTLPPGSFDVVYHCDLVSHFLDPRESLRQMAALLKPGGVLCFEAGLLACVSSGWHRVIRRVGLEHHLWLYTRPGLDRIIRESGLEIVASQRFGLIPYLFAGRAAALASKLVSRGLRATRTEAGRRLAVPVDAWQHRVRHALRYRMGPYAPQVGPQTLLFVVRPTG
jgi:SAM-dependent methyltransferase